MQTIRPTTAIEGPRRTRTPARERRAPRRAPARRIVRPLRDRMAPYRGRLAPAARFKAAHALAREYRQPGDDYRTVFGLALAWLS